MKRFLAGMLCFMMMFCMMPAVEVNADDPVQYNIGSFKNAEDVLEAQGLADVTFDAGVMTIKLKDDITGDLIINITTTTVEGSSEEVGTVRLDANEKTVTGTLIIGDTGAAYDGTYVLTGDGTFNQMTVASAHLIIESVTVLGEIKMYPSKDKPIEASFVDGYDFTLVKFGVDKNELTNLEPGESVFVTSGKYTIDDYGDCYYVGAVVKQYKSGDTDPVNIGDTNDMDNIDALKEKLGCVADITETDDGKINIKLNYNILGRICFAIPDTTVVFNANGHTLTGGDYNQPICLQNMYDYDDDILTVELIGDGIYNTGAHSTVFVGTCTNLVLKSATINGTLDSYTMVTAKLEDGYDYYRILKNGTAVTVSGSEEIDHTVDYNLNSFSNGTLVVKPYKVCVEHSYGDDNICDVCGYEKAVAAPAITTQPADASVKVGETATFTVAATGTDLTYQWQINRNDGNGFVNITNATSASYTTSTVDKDCNGFKYQCVVSNSAGSVTSSTATLTVTAPTYTITEGADSEWTQGSDKTITFRADGDFAKFTGVKVNGTLLDAKYYTAVSGSTVVTLTEEYLDTLEAGTYELTVVFTDGECSTDFEIKKAASDNDNQPDDDDDESDNDDESDDNNQSGNDNQSGNGTVTPPTSGGVVTSPATGDNNTLYVFGLLMSGAAFIGVNVYSKKKITK